MIYLKRVHISLWRYARQLAFLWIFNSQWTGGENVYSIPLYAKDPIYGCLDPSYRSCIGDSTVGNVRKWSRSRARGCDVTISFFLVRAVKYVSTSNKVSTQLACRYYWPDQTKCTSGILFELAGFCLETRAYHKVCSATAPDNYDEFAKAAGKYAVIILVSLFLVLCLKHFY